MYRLMIFILAGPLFGQHPTVPQRIGAQAAASFGMVPLPTNYAEPPKTVAENLETAPAIAVESFEVKRPNSASTMTGSRVRFPPFKGIIVHAWFLADSVGKEIGVTLHFKSPH